MRSQGEVQCVSGAGHSSRFQQCCAFLPWDFFKLLMMGFLGWLILMFFGQEENVMQDLNSLLSEQLPGDSAADLLAVRRNQFAQANASLAIEGLHVSDADRAIQERIASGQLTHDDGVAQYLKTFGA